MTIFFGRCSCNLGRSSVWVCSSTPDHISARTYMIFITVVQRLCCSLLENLGPGSQLLHCVDNSTPRPRFAYFVVFLMNPEAYELIGLWIFFARASAYGACVWTGLLFLTMSHDFLNVASDFLARLESGQSNVRSSSGGAVDSSPTGTGRSGTSSGSRSIFAGVSRTLLHALKILLENHKDLHVFAAVEVTLDGLLHTTMHLCGTFPAVESSSTNELNAMMTCAMQARKHPPPGYLDANRWLKPVAFPRCPLDETVEYGYFTLVWSTCGLTGILLLFVLGLFWYYSRAARRHRDFNTFQSWHAVLVPAWFVLCVLHAANGMVGIGFPLVILVAGPAIGLYCCGLVRMAFSQWAGAGRVRFHHVEFSSSGKLVYMELRQGIRWCQRRPKAGVYYQLCSPTVSPREWHPFSLCAFRDDVAAAALTTRGVMDQDGDVASLRPLPLPPQNDRDFVYLAFLISACGDWTKQLCTTIRESSSHSGGRILEHPGCGTREKKNPGVSTVLTPRELQQLNSLCKLRLNGPFAAPSVRLISRRNPMDVVIAAGCGVGFTPFFSFLTYLSGETSWDPLFKQAHVFWQARDPSDFLFLAPCLENLVKHPDARLKLRIQLFTTMKIPETGAGRLFWMSCEEEWDCYKALMGTEAKAIQKLLGVGEGGAAVVGNEPDSRRAVRGSSSAVVAGEQLFSRRIMGGEKIVQVTPDVAAPDERTSTRQEWLPNSAFYPRPLLSVMTTNLLSRGSVAADHEDEQRLPFLITWGRVNWFTELYLISQASPGTDLHTFFCGPDAVRKDVEGACGEVNTLNAQRGEKGRLHFAFERF